MNTNAYPLVGMFLSRCGCSISDDCPYKPVDGHEAQFESKTVAGAIYNCPYGLIFDYDATPCGCFREKQVPIGKESTPTYGRRPQSRSFPL